MDVKWVELLGSGSPILSSAQPTRQEGPCLLWDEPSTGQLTRRKMQLGSSHQIASRWGELSRLAHFYFYFLLKILFFLILFTSQLLDKPTSDSQEIPNLIRGSPHLTSLPYYIKLFPHCKAMDAMDLDIIISYHELSFPRL